MDQPEVLGVNERAPDEEDAVKNTKWHQAVELGPPELPEGFWQIPGVTPVIGAVDEKVGEEILLLINDPTEDAETLANLENFELNVGSGAIETEYGSLGFILFIVPDHQNPGQPHAVWEILYDPQDDEMTAPFRGLSEQSHWHAMIFGPGPDVLDILEFQNNYFLEEGLKEVDAMVADSPCTDFAKAVEAAHEAYSLEELYAAATPEDLSALE